MNLIHTPECIARDAALQKIFDEWVAKWPNYCKACNGWGGAWSKYDPSPSGVSLSSGYMEDFDPCSVCSDELLCARCMAKNPQWEDGNDTPCTSCGWNPAKPDGLPNPFRDYPCPCELEYEKKLEAEWADHKRSEYQDMIDNMKG